MTITSSLCAKNTSESSAMVTINGKKYEVPASFSEVSLNDYLRTHLHLTGTKVMCREGGCGVCIVHAVYPDPAGSGQKLQRSINSCLRPILSCDGWEITTVEGLGDQKKPHVIQQTLADHYGTQCGYCTPGMVMSMHSLRESNKDGSLTEKALEDSFGGNLCRCTGYRPILDAFKNLANQDSCNGIDLEDLGLKICEKSGQKCQQKCGSHEIVSVKPLPVVIGENAAPWHSPASLLELYQLKENLKEQNVYYLVGHTGIGVYDDGPYDAYVDLRKVKELFAVTKNAGTLSIGAGLALTDVIGHFRREASQTAGLQYLDRLADLINKTAHIAVRNVGSIGGNLAIKNRHREFPSDSFTCLAVCNAQIVIGPGEKSYSAEEFLSVDLKDKIILRIELKSFGQEYIFRTFKVMPRSQNAHGYVNAGFRAKLNKDQPGQIILTEKPSIVLGNISENFVHASETEAFLCGKDVADLRVVEEALTILQEEVQPEEKSAEATPLYRRTLSLSLFYKFLLEIVADKADERYRSAVEGLIRPVSTGSQSFPTKKENWPVTQPIPKIESLIQTTGEAKFISDIDQEGMLHAAFASSTVGNATISSIHTAAALAVPGVVKVFTAADIPGENNFAAPPFGVELILADGRITYCGQPIAIVVAVTRDAAEAGAKELKVHYSDVKPAITSCQDAIREESFFGQPQVYQHGDFEKATARATNRVSGALETGSQIHYHTENQVAVAYPTEDGLDIDAGTQWLDFVQDAVAGCCALNKNVINVRTRRNGGAFGGKITRNNLIASAVAVAALLTNKPVKMHMSLWDNSKSVGKRTPFYITYEAATDEFGKLCGVKMDIYCNLGSSNNDSPFSHWNCFADSAYKCPAWKLTYHSCKTNIPANTFCRAPGILEAFYAIETVLEHTAWSLGRSAVEVKQLNFYKDGDKTLAGVTLSDVQTQNILTQLLQKADFEGRCEKIKKFNSGNRWKKRGMSVVPLRYGAAWLIDGVNLNYSCSVSIFHNGGTVAVTHAGIEMGQGINTKVAQVVARELGINLSFISVQPSQTLTSANAAFTGVSITSEIVCQGAIKACEELRSRIDPVRHQLGENSSWELAIEACYNTGVDLSARSWAVAKKGLPTPYATYAGACTEVELDVLTGEYQILRMDAIHDCGQSISPLVDIGQIEGGIVMGLGVFTSEEVIYERQTGANLSNGTWKYKPPTATDIPIDFRVEILHNASNRHGILRSKLVAEPPTCTTCSVVFALREAITAKLAEDGKVSQWLEMITPVTVERAQQYCSIQIAQLTLRE